MFASYIGLALHHAKLYDKIKKNEQKYKVVQEVVNYQSSAPQHEVQEVKPSWSGLVKPTSAKTDDFSEKFPTAYVLREKNITDFWRYISVCVALI